MMSYCSQCGAALELRIPEMDDRLRHCCNACGAIHYENPKIVVGVLPVFDEKILLCKRAIEPQKGLWTVPSGFMENGESLEDGALREAYEEAGIRPQLTRLHTIYSLPHINQVYFLFLGKMLDDQSKKGIETEALEWVTLTDIPWSDLAFSSVKFALKAYQKDLSSGNTQVHSGVYKVS